jgi:hypothetical protein
MKVTTLEGADGGGADVAGNYVKQPNLKFLTVELWGAGAAGQNSSATAATTGSVGAGGGGGAYCKKTYRADELAASEPYLIGRGGTTPSGVSQNGNNSTFKGMTAGGGAATVGGAAAAVALPTSCGRSAWGLATGGDVNIDGNGSGVGHAATGNTSRQADGGAGALSTNPRGRIASDGTTQAGANGNHPGGGGCGALSVAGGAAGQAGVGAGGRMVLTEYFVDGDTVEGSSFVNMRKTYVTTTGAGTYVPPAGLKYVEVELVAAGGNGGLAELTSTGQSSAGGGGGGGAYCKKLYAASDLNAAGEPYVLGARSGSSNGSAADTTFKGMTAGGGAGGSPSTAGTAGQVAGGSGGSATGGDLNVNGSAGLGGVKGATGNPAWAGKGFGGGNFYAPNMQGTPISSGAATLTNPIFPGGGGQGGAIGASQPQASGGIAANGMIVFTEYF